MPRRPIRAATLRRRLLQQRGIVQEKDKPLPQRFRPGPERTSTKLKTTLMLLKEIEYNRDITEILTSGPLIHTGGTITKTNCHRCIWCMYHIKPSIASKWRKRLGLPRYEEVAS